MELNQQSLNQQSRVIRNHLGEFLKELAFVDRRWIRLDSCFNDVFVPKGKTEEVDCPLESLCDLLGVSAEKANDYLCAAKLMTLHNKYKTMGIVTKNWESLICEFGLDIEFEAVTDIHVLGKRMHAIRIGCLGKNNRNTAFSAIKQATRFFVGEAPVFYKGENNVKQIEGFKKGWEPERLRGTRQSNELLSKMSLDLAIFMTMQQKELDEKERMGKQQKELDEKEQMAKQQKELDEKEQSLAYKSQAKSKWVEFNMDDPKTEPIRWKSPNGKTQTAVHIPCSSTRAGFRMSAKRTGWIEQVVANMFDKAKVPEEVGVEWLIEAIWERYRPQFDAFCVRKGYVLPVKRTLKERRQMSWKKAKLKRELEKDKDETIVTGNEAAMRDGLAGSQSLT
jgi:hypothetical protein